MLDRMDVRWRSILVTAYHPAGNCKLRIDPIAAADHKLRVNGVYGLPISGALIMPVVVSGNRNTPAIMIGETASALVLGAAQ